MPTTKPAEIVLPSGRFATCRNITVLDWLIALKSEKEHGDVMVTLVTRCVTIDSQGMDVEEVLNLPLEEYWPIINMVSKKIERARLTENGVK
jgi:hypothetical protein